MSRLLLCMSLLLLALPAPGQAANPFPKAATAYLVKSGEATVWSQGANRRLPPASLTKMMTALVVMESADFADVVTVSPAAAAATGSRLRLHAGDRLRVGDLLAAILLNSANDAAHALADHVAGSEEKFAVLMNRKAAELGMQNTRFANCSGFDHPQHYSTAVDLALLAEAALAQPPFRGMVGLPDMEISTIDGARVFQLKTTNRLLGSYDGLIGGKTGFTAKAGPCLIVVAERADERVLVVLLNSPSRWNSAPTILDRAFSLMAKERSKTRVASLAGKGEVH
ncbi:MAG: D-alanyl-D-alanine carboxypeptidase [Desulfuromonadales bacterium]|nr:D-alanyl-D-alanine carboxypeptidase [Desulfuromonadales bacterium]